MTVTTGSTDPLSPSLLRSTFGAVGQYLVLPLAVLICGVVTVHSVALMGFEWQWTLAKWGYPTLCVGALFALVFLKHWSVQTVLRGLVPLMVVVSTAGYAYKAGVDDNGGLFAQTQLEHGNRVAALTKERDQALADLGEAQATLQLTEAALETAQEENKALAALSGTPPAKTAAKPRLYRKPEPSLLDQLLEWVP